MTANVAASPSHRHALLPLAATAVGGFAIMALAQLAFDLYRGRDIGSATLVPTVDLMAVAIAPVICFAVEILLVGWQRSSLRKLLKDRSASALSDIAYFILFSTGGMMILARLGTLGVLDWAEQLSGAKFGLLPLADLPLWASLPLLWLTLGFTSYWEHRVMHSRWLWDLHKGHHSAHEMNMVIAFRSHALEYGVSGIVNTLTLVVMGFGADAIAVLSVIATLWPLYLHSNWTSIRWLEKVGLCTPAGHRLHHAAAAEMHDLNFADTLNIWDRLFGTYAYPEADIDSLEIGVRGTDIERCTGTLNPLQETVLQTIDWFRTLRTELAATWTTQNGSHRDPATT
jgi:sterol desaturase/sphingolipid hydroxylase (fatty acid hydroxylase superfamily)